MGRVLWCSERHAERHEHSFYSAQVSAEDELHKSAFEPYCNLRSHPRQQLHAYSWV
jgi:hypothetical protein